MKVKIELFGENEVKIEQFSNYKEVMIESQNQSTDTLEIEDFNIKSSIIDYFDQQYFTKKEVIFWIDKIIENSATERFEIVKKLKKII